MIFPLQGLKILDLTMNLPGPYMTWLMALLGAEVLKVENPSGGDYARALGDAGEASPFFEELNRNKKSLALNLKNDKGKRIFLDLLDTYDVLVEGFRPGAMDKLGLGYSEVHALKPRVIYASITGYGHDSLFRLRAGHDINYLARSGVLGMTGTRDGRPVVPGIQAADFIGGSMLSGIGLLAAIISRGITGRGQFVDTSMFDGVLAGTTMAFSTVKSGMEKALPGKMLLNGRFPCYNTYVCKDGRYMALGAIEFKFWQNFCLSVDRPDLVPGHYGDDQVTKEVVKIFQTRTQGEWRVHFEETDACCDPVLTLEEAVVSDLANSRRMLVRHNGLNYLGNPLKLSDVPELETVASPALGRHTEETLLGTLGMSIQEIERLEAEGVVRR